MVALNFSARTVAPNTALEPLPSGTYPVTITKSEEKPTKSGNGSYLELEMSVQGGQYNGRKLYDRLNIKNPSEQAVAIAYGTLSAICYVTGRLDIQDTQQLHGAPFQVVVSKQERPDQKGVFTNEVNGYKDMAGNDPGKEGAPAQGGGAPSWAGGGAPQQQAPQQQPPAGGAPQWQQGAPQQQYAPPQGQQAPPQQWQQPPAQPQAPVQGGAPAWTQAPPQGQQQQVPPQQQAPQQQPPMQQAPAPQTQQAPPWAQQG